MLRNWIVLCLSLLPMLVRADDASIRATARSVNSTAHVQAIRTTPIPGVSAVVTDGSVYYMSDDGRYVLYGIMLDTQQGKNLTDDLLGQARTGLLEQLRPSDVIDFPATGASIGTVTVFLDTECQYCRALHAAIGDYRKAGIHLRIVPWPAGSMRSTAFRSAVDVWCAKDRALALDKSMHGQAIPSQLCDMESRIIELKDMGQRLGVQGTPALFDEHGHLLGGFLSPAALAEKLRESSNPGDA